jgi:hypothetical protein
LLQCVSKRIDGLTCDCLLSVDLVDANGSVLKASKDQNSDLFWALQGGGGNFGVVTGNTCIVLQLILGFEFQLYPVGEIILLQFHYNREDIKQVLQMYKKFTSTAPQNLSVFLWIAAVQLLFYIFLM